MLTPLVSQFWGPHIWPFFFTLPLRGTDQDRASGPAGELDSPMAWGSRQLGSWLGRGLIALTHLHICLMLCWRFLELLVDSQLVSESLSIYFTN